MWVVIGAIVLFGIAWLRVSLHRTHPCPSCGRQAIQLRDPFDKTAIFLCRYCLVHFRLQKK